MATIAVQLNFKDLLQESAMSFPLHVQPSLLLLFAFGGRSPSLRSCHTAIIELEENGL